MILIRNNNIYRILLAAILLPLFIFSCRQESSQDKIEVTYEERYRPQFHFSPARNWMNDPNGLVYQEGEYHLFYQHNPFGNTWGHMSWGHAVSNDLLHWQHLPVALKEENNIMIFSGSAVVDHNNTTGLGSKEKPPLVAIYTGHHTDKKLQDQRIAYSLDNGRTWTKYEGNPVIDEEMADFRDPKVFWHEDSSRWIMALALSTEQKVRFYGSKDLKNWIFLSDFGPAGAAGDILWECPDLFQLPVDGDSDQVKWVLQVDVNPGAVAGGSGGQYFVGEFDGERFIEDTSTKGRILWADYGRDFYAVQSYSDIPGADGRRIWLAWMNNWDYANEIPTDPWRSAMTLPREVGLTSTDGEVRLTQRPVRELQNLRGDHLREADVRLPDGSNVILPDFQGKSYEMIAEIDLREADTVGIRVRKGENEETVIGYDVANQQLFTDRRQSGEVDFDPDFASVQQAPLPVDDNRLRLHIFVDWSSVEVFSSEGSVTITDRIFPSPDSRGLEFFSQGGDARLVSVDFWEMESIWEKMEN